MGNSSSQKAVRKPRADFPLARLRRAAGPKRFEVGNLAREAMDLEGVRIRELARAQLSVKLSPAVSG